MKLAAIVLAAGAGRRFGGGKLIAEYRDRPLIHHALRAADAAPVDEIVVVVGAEADQVTRAISRCPLVHPMRMVFAAGWNEGMSASLRAGCSALALDVSGAFILLGDMPAIPPEIFKLLSAAISNGAPAAAPICGDNRGHPVLLGRNILKRVQQLRGDEGAKPLLRSVALIPTSDRGVLFDIDKVADISRRDSAATNAKRRNA